MSAGIAVLLAVSGLALAGCRNSAASGRDQGDWAAFYTSGQDRSQYFYDRAGLQPGSDRLEARWKRVNTQGVTTFYRIEIHCRARTFTELETVIVEPNGQEQEVPGSERWTGHAIVPNSSTDVFARRFCPAQTT
jgi:hypothetical protein